MSVNKSIKEQLRHHFHLWYSEKIHLQDSGNADHTPVNVAMSFIKTLSVKWLIAVYKYIVKNSDIIVKEFKKAGLSN